MHNVGALGAAPAQERAQRTLDQTVRSVGRTLSAERPRFRVSFRLYHGWHKGWQPTDGFKAAAQAVGATDFTALSHHRVDFSPAVQYGHTLIEALPERQHRRPPIHLPNTLRDQEKGQPPAEKMVDTALAADLLAWARRSPSEWALVLAEDDYVAPPLFAAEALARSRGADRGADTGGRPRCGQAGTLRAVARRLGRSYCRAAKGTPARRADACEAPSSTTSHHEPPR